MPNKNKTVNKTLSSYKHICDEINDKAVTFSNYLPEINYYGLSTYAFLLSHFIKELQGALPQPGGIGLFWGYSDAACSTIIGINQLFDKQSHRQRVTKLKGVTNIASGIQLATLT